MLFPPSLSCSQDVEAAQKDPDHDQHDSQEQAAAEDGHHADDDQDDAYHPDDGDRAAVEYGGQQRRHERVVHGMLPYLICRLRPNKTSGQSSTASTAEST